METRICRRCQTLRDLECFEEIPGGRRKVCRVCRNSAHAKPTLAQDCEKHRKWRAKNPHSAILYDCRAFDKKHEFDNDLDREFIKALIVSGCRYCGETKLRMTLDRIDNSVGHIKANVLPCCIRCNYIRGSMPFDAWMVMVPAVRQAREAGLFGTWRSVPFNRKT